MGLSCCLLLLFGADPEELLRSAQKALEQGKVKEALAQATEVITKEPTHVRAHLVRGVAYEAAREHDKAIADFDRVIQLDPKNADAFNHRGSEHFKLGHVEQSIKDFDRYIELRPDEMPGHWKRGISFYYAGRFEDGRKQFEGYEKVDTNDVENAVWHFLCVARKDGVAKAREKLLKIGNDRRVPMKQVYSLFADKLKPAEVLEAAQTGEVTPAERKQRLFYAHLYLGLYYEVTGDARKTLEHMTEAAEKYRIGHYMGDVAAVHLELLRKKAKP